MTFGNRIDSVTGLDHVLCEGRSYEDGRCDALGGLWSEHGDDWCHIHPDRRSSLLDGVG